MDIKQKLPGFSLFTDLICLKNPLQKKALLSFLETRDELFFVRAEEFARKLLPLLRDQDITVEYVVDSYLTMCREILQEQTRFLRTGKYSRQTAAEAYADIYSSEKEMTAYLYGIALSQFLWPNHYAMYDFFCTQSRNLTDIRAILEIGPGHGLFLAQSIANFPKADFTAVDISPASARMAETIIKYFTGYTGCRFLVQDVNELGDGSFDYVVMGEVLEHLDDPMTILQKIHGLLTTGGRFFLTTCANCPVKDHVYLYDSVAQIRQQIMAAGFAVVSDLPLAVGDFPESEWQDRKLVVNYAAMCEKI
ncbi:MAG: class I SAM-dependent methyltransferase [Deltaproteobacteria bacterium]|nr:class I SAM-dependent methyltransferase [Deltaproteobacteria bacterium]